MMDRGRSTCHAVGEPQLSFPCRCAIALKEFSTVLLVFNVKVCVLCQIEQQLEGQNDHIHAHVILWMVAKSCTN